MTLSAEQWTFIACRLLAKTDTEAAQSVGIHPATVYGWKREDPEFLQQYEAAFTDGVEVAKGYTRKLLGKAAQRLNEGLDATKVVALEVVGEYDENGKRVYEERAVSDHKSRLEAVKLLFQTHSLLVTKAEITGKDGGPIVTADAVALSKLTDEELALYERLCQRAAGN